MDLNHLNNLVSKYQSIKIVPSFEDTMRDMGLNTDVDPETRLWFQQLKVTWKTWKKSTPLENHIEKFFLSIPDMHRLGLVFVIKSEDFKDCKPKTLPYFIIEIVQKCAHSRGILPDNALRMPAFKIATYQKNQSFLNLMVKTYQLDNMKEIILPIVKDMIKNDNCKQASQIVLALELFDEIPVENLLFPLVLQNRPNMIDEYLAECPKQVESFVLFLDKLLDKNFNVREYVQKYIEGIKMNNIQYDKIHPKPLGKLVARLCNKFNIPIEFCKNLSRNRTTGGLRYLLYQKYVENNVSSSVWDDLVKDSLKQIGGTGLDFIDMLAEYDKNEALKWAQYLNISIENYPSSIKNWTMEDEDKTENWDAEVSASEEFFKFRLTDDNIIIIDSAEKFYDLTCMLSKCSIISIDCEWKPSFGATQSQVALIQVSTMTNVYLIDTVILNKQEYNSFWNAFNKSLLDNAEIIKVGFGLEQDLKEIKASILGLSNIKVKGEGLLDLGLLWKALSNNGLSLPGNSNGSGNSLSSLVQSCFGAPLEKSEQCSNWELRPLRKTQIEYAALDAHVLLDVYYYLQNVCAEQNISFEDISNDVMLERRTKSTKKSKVIERFQIFGNQSKSAQKIKFIVEPTLSFLLAYLRLCGIDTTVVPSTMLWHDVINMAISDNRLILVNKLKCSPTVNYPQSSILEVGKSSILDIIQKVFNTYNISVVKDDILTRCILCNDIEMTKLNPDEVIKLCEEYTSSGENNFYAYHRYDNNYEDGHDGYEDFLSDDDCDDIELYQPVKKEINQNKLCKTKKGAKIDISEPQKLLSTHKPAVLCETCGKVYWENDELLEPISKVIVSVIKLNIW